MLRHTTNEDRRRELPSLTRIPGQEKLLDWKAFASRLSMRGDDIYRTEAGQLAELQWAVDHCGSGMPESLLKACKDVIGILSAKTKGQSSSVEVPSEQRLLRLIRAAMEEAPGPRVRIPPSFVQIAVKQKLDGGDPRYTAPRSHYEDED